MQLQLPLLCEGHIGICDWNSSRLQLLPLRNGHLIFFSFSLVTTVITTPAPLRGAYYAPSRKEKKLMITTHATLWETISGRATIYRYPILQHSPMRALKKKKKSTNGRCDYNSRSSTRNSSVNCKRFEIFEMPKRRCDYNSFQSHNERYGIAPEHLPKHFLKSFVYYNAHPSGAGLFCFSKRIVLYRYVDYIILFLFWQMRF